MTSAFAIAQQTSTLLAAAPRITASSPEQFNSIVGQIDQQVQKFETQLSAMIEEQGENEHTKQIQSDGIVIIQNIERIKSLAKKRFELQQKSGNLRSEFHDLQSKVTSIVIEKIDDQTFYMMTGYKSLEEKKSPYSVHFSESEFLIYRSLSDLREAVTVAERLLADTFIVTDVAMLEPLRERFEATSGSIIRSLAVIDEYEQQGNHALHSPDGENQLFDVLKNGTPYDYPSFIFEDLISFGRKEGNGFDLRSQELDIDNELSSLLSENQVLGIEIVAQIRRVVNDSSMAAGEMASKATSVTATSVKLLVVVNIISISGAILFGWLLVQRRLIRRLEQISNHMQQMANGNLELDIEVKGDDEIAQLAKALEVFRNNALEVEPPEITRWR
ncbi:MAG: HAMP domain-containing protein [Candidatus Dadabacteria bacterium]|nr:HAMP domain-containing protein [Candidatus Dadabacteria bacterium]